MYMISLWLALNHRFSLGFSLGWVLGSSVYISFLSASQDKLNTNLALITLQIDSHKGPLLFLIRVDNKSCF